MARKHSQDEVLKSLRYKNDVRIEENSILILKDEIYSKEKQCMIPNPKKKWDLGNSSWGKISYLVNYCGYYTVSVGNF